MLEKLNTTRTCTILVLVVILILAAIVVFGGIYCKNHGGVKETLGLKDATPSDDPVNDDPASQEDDDNRPEDE